MSPRVAYWTSAMSPEMEAIAGEVAALRQRFRGSVAWGINPNSWGQISWRRGFGFHPRLHLLFRGTTRVLQRAFQINHLFGGVGDWFHLRSAMKRPIVLTVAVRNAACDPALLDKVDQFAFEWPVTPAELSEMGIDADRVRVVLPPVDLSRFRPMPPPDGPFTVLFASSPNRSDWLEARGVPALLDAAALRPEYRFRMLWRPWGESLPAVRTMIAERGLKNVDVHCERVSDMAAEYHAAHATAAIFQEVERCKAVPNSLLESMACGRPVVTTRAIGIADMIDRAGAGEVCSGIGSDIVTALDSIRDNWQQQSVQARSLAEQEFSMERFLDDYAVLYGELLCTEASRTQRLSQPTA